MKKRPSFARILLTTILIIGVVSAFGYNELKRPPTVEGDVRLPFEDGRFVVSYEELNDGRSWLMYVRRPEISYWGITHRTPLILGLGACHSEFINIMNDISPVLVEAVITDDSNPHRNRFTPFSFRAVALRYSRYNFTVGDYTLMMDIHEAASGGGYLSFLIFDSEREVVDGINRRTSCNFGHRSLYRITQEELEKLTGYIEGLGRTDMGIHDSGTYWIGHIYRRTRNLIEVVRYDITN